MAVPEGEGPRSWPRLRSSRCRRSTPWSREAQGAAFSFKAHDIELGAAGHELPADVPVRAAGRPRRATCPATPCSDFGVMATDAAPASTRRASGRASPASPRPSPAAAQGRGARHPGRPGALEGVQRRPASGSRVIPDDGPAATWSRWRRCSRCASTSRCSPTPPAGPGAQPHPPLVPRRGGQHWGVVRTGGPAPPFTVPADRYDSVDNYAVVRWQSA